MNMPDIKLPNFIHLYTDLFKTKYINKNITDNNANHNTNYITVRKNWNMQTKYRVCFNDISFPRMSTVLLLVRSIKQLNY